jgi:LDH2 family malate/lactate/ureidoglycolate dehydrogenase
MITFDGHDPAVMWREPIGAMLPFAQHKGCALAIMCEILGGALSGGQVQDGWPRPRRFASATVCR